MTKAQIAAEQEAMNRFTDRYLKHVTPLVVDGDDGPATRARVRAIKYWLGWPKESVDGSMGERFQYSVRHPKTRSKWTKSGRLARGGSRRINQRRRARKSHAKAAKATGVGHFDGKPVANWLIPYLQWARDHGWKGTVASGWRSPSYSKQLCMSMCGRPSCPGKCAGASSNHAGSTKPRGAIDVTHYSEFGALMRRCPLSPHIYNALGPADPVHFSASGR